MTKQKYKFLRVRTSTMKELKELKKKFNMPLIVVVQRILDHYKLTR